MSKGKRKRKEQIQRAIHFELYGIALFTASLIAMASLGAVGRSLTYLSRFLVGTWDFIIPLTGMILSLYIMVKRRWPTGWSPRWTGVVLIILAFLVLNHMSMMDALGPEDRGKTVLALTWEKILAERQAELPTDIGGGMIGGLVYSLFEYLFDEAGTPIAVVSLLLAGSLLATGFSFVHVVRSIRERVRRWLTGWKQELTERWLKRRKSSARRKKRPKKTAQPPLGEMEGGDAEVPVIHDFTEKEHQREFSSSSESGRPQQLTLPLKEREEKPEPKEQEKASVKVHFQQTDLDPSEYRLPPYSLLNKQRNTNRGEEKQEIKSKAKKLEATLESFGVRAKVTHAHRGPAVTRYEVHPEVGVKVSRIVNLADDLALALAARDIRIEAPIPGKSAVGIEVPNPEIAMVGLRDLLESSAYHESPSKLSLVLGRDISGEPVVGDLAKMPHLLVAGATGSGKSVCINAMITSLLYKAKPNEVKMMMVDPKMVELNVYNGIPHLLTPVVTDARRAAVALKKVVAEMEKRYGLFAKTGARDIERYNQMIEGDPEREPLPYIVVIIDELADLMMVAPADVEDAICRLAQMARAAGIHLIIATQRPSVDVITGVIKANIPSRIAFSVSSQADSRTILDMGGAEKLLGRGDMLYLPVGSSKPIRVQGAFVSDKEVEAVVQFVKGQQEARYNEEMIPDVKESEGEEAMDDELYPEAVRLVVEARVASASMLQRRLRIGYTRAARLIDLMESRGVVGPYEGSKPREVLITPEQLHARKQISI
jgi:S-DNA-T family DNA segregation ATPase FtsK/SpoIIIE